GDIVCRYTSSTSANVNYYTCTELANFYDITVQEFFQLNPLVNPDCSNIKPSTEYCVAGYIQRLLATNENCGPIYGNASCLGTDLQCCNSGTWKCGNAAADCQAGTCYEGACEGFPSKYSLNGTCGPKNDGKMCAGKWGNCCSLSGQCGTGTDFCGKGKCYSGACYLPPMPTDVPWQTGNTPDGTCGGTNGYTCDVVFGNCCSKDGKCIEVKP
ncbi:carbohydrate-binding module family 18 protein, partial [Periconia macrospinosa]